MFQLLRLLVLSYFTLTACWAEQGVHICSNFSYCRCNERDYKVSLSCNVTDDPENLSKLRQELQFQAKKFIHLSNCSSSYLPRDLFTNVSLVALSIVCPLDNMDVDTFVDSESFEYLNVRHTKFKLIPPAISVLRNIRTLRLNHGQISYLGSELHNMHDLMFLSMASNNIERVARDAFIHNRVILQIDLSRNKISFFYPETFRFCRTIRNFDASNNKLDSIVPLSTVLQTLSLRNNKLRSIQRAFQRYFQIKSIIVSQNKFQESVSDSTFSPLRGSVRHLDMSWCDLRVLPPRLLRPLLFLRIINLQKNNLREIPEGFFHTLKLLQKVVLSKNRLSFLDEIFKENPALEVVDLSENRLQELGNSFSYKDKLTTLALSRNRLTLLRKEDFERTRSLSKLLIDSNHIARIETSVFSSTNLKYLDLDRNRIQCLNGSIRNLRSLETLYLRHNSISNLDQEDVLNLNSLRTMSLAGNKLRNVNGAFRHLKNLLSLNLRENKLQTFSKNSLYQPFYLQNLYLGTNRMVCDCRLPWLRNFFLYKNISNNGSPVYCNKPIRFQGKKLVDLSEEDLVKWPDGCPPPCECTCVDDNENFHVKVDCSHRNLSLVPSTFPENIGQLNLQGNSIVELNLDIAAMKNLMILDIENNSLENINFTVPDNLSTLKLANNSLSRFFEKPPASVSLWTLSNNPWICDCSTRNFSEWMIKNMAKIPDVHATRCKSNNPMESLSDKIIIDLLDSDLCPAMISTYIIIAVNILIVLLTGTSSSLIYSRYHYHMKVWLHSRGFRCLKKEENQDRGKLYDAFISSADNDFLLVKDVLLPELEMKPPNYKIFEPRRNMKAGEMFEFEKEMEVATLSRRVIIVLSEHYIKNNFLLQVFKTAFEKSLEEKQYRLILILVGDLPHLSDIDQSLKAAIESTRCLKLGQKLFWEMLRFAMPKTSLTLNVDCVAHDNTQDVAMLQA